jgi:hypothetical protein
MAIVEVDFDSEKELENWVRENITDFFPDSIYIPGCSITTVSGKSGVPDGFVFNLEQYEWYVLEAELLSHGVWPHIAEQIIRFVVATQNPQARRTVRDKLFEHIDATKSIEAAAKKLDTSPERLLQQIELYVEGVEPQFAIFIDKTNQDLLDMVRALSAQTRVYQVRKFMVDGKPQFFSPDQNIPVIETAPGEEGELRSLELDLVGLLGEITLQAAIHRFKCYRLVDGSVIYVKRSKYYARNDNYWYGILPSTLEYCNQYKVTHIVFIMGQEGVVKVPIGIVREYLNYTGTTLYEDGTIRHYHCLISPGPEPELYWSNEKPKFLLKEYYMPST